MWSVAEKTTKMKYLGLVWGSFISTEDRFRTVYVIHVIILATSISHDVSLSCDSLMDINVCISKRIWIRKQVSCQQSWFLNLYTMLTTCYIVDLDSKN